MSLSSDRIETLGNELYQALRSRSVIEPLTDREAGIDIDDAYAISLHMLERRREDGERVVGKKIGVTSEAVQNMLGVHQPDFGFLTAPMHLANGASVSLAKTGLIQPKAEGEIAFVLKRDLRGPGITAEQVIDATEYVSPCFEIVDSRIRDWNIKIQDTIADNASCGVFVMGEAQIDPRSLDLAAVELNIERNGEHIASGTGAAVQGHPATAVAWLANTLGRYNIPFLAGEFILSGSLAPLLPIAAGDHYALSLSGIGAASISFTD